MILKMNRLEAIQLIHKPISDIPRFAVARDVKMLIHK